MNYPIEYSLKIGSNGCSYDTNPLWKALWKLSREDKGFEIIEADGAKGKMTVKVSTQSANSEMHWLCLKVFFIKASIAVVA